MINLNKVLEGVTLQEATSEHKLGVTEFNFRGVCFELRKTDGGWTLYAEGDAVGFFPLDVEIKKRFLTINKCVFIVYWNSSTFAIDDVSVIAFTVASEVSNDAYKLLIRKEEFFLGVNLNNLHRGN